MALLTRVRARVALTTSVARLNTRLRPPALTGPPGYHPPTLLGAIPLGTAGAPLEAHPAGRAGPLKGLQRGDGPVHR